MSSALLLTKVDDLLRGEHVYLDANDHCYFLHEYTARAGFSHSESNRLIWNLKKSVDRRDKAAEWRHKISAIQTCADELITAIKASRRRGLEGALLVPTPPSKTKAHALHDDRICQVAQLLSQGLSLEVAELLENRGDREPQRASKAKRDIEALQANLHFNASALVQRPKGIFLVDDVLTTGATFAACKKVLQRHLAGIQVVGIFVARRVPSPQADDSDNADF